MMHICVGKLTIIGSDNGLSPDRRQAIIWTNAGILLIGPLGTNFSEILIEILTFSFKKMRLKGSSAKRWPSCLDLNVIMEVITHPCWDLNLSILVKRANGEWARGHDISWHLTMLVTFCMYCEYVIYLYRWQKQLDKW